MAKKAPRGIGRRAENVPVEEPTAAEQAEASAAEARDMLAGVTQEGVTAKLYRSHPSIPGGEHFVDEIDGALFSEVYVKTNYGGGKYRAEIIGLTDRGRARPSRGKIGQETFLIDFKIPPRRPAHEMAAESATAAAATPPSFNDALTAALNGATIQLLKGYQDMGNLQTAMLERALGSRDEEKRAPIEWDKVLVVAIPAVTAFVTTLVTNRPKAADTVKELAAMMELAKSTQPAPPPRQKSSLEEMRETLEFAREVRESLGSEGESATDTRPPWWVDLAKAGAQVLADVTAARQAPQGPVTVVDMPPAEQLKAAPAEPPQPESDAVAFLSPIMTALRPHRGQIVQWAREGRDAGWVAETLLFEIPSGFVPVLRQHLEREEVIPELARGMPEFVPHEPWLQQVRAALVELIDGEEEEESAS